MLYKVVMKATLGTKSSQAFRLGTNVTSPLQAWEIYFSMVKLSAILWDRWFPHPQLCRPTTPYLPMMLSPGRNCNFNQYFLSLGAFQPVLFIFGCLASLLSLMGKYPLHCLLNEFHNLNDLRKEAEKCQLNFRNRNKASTSAEQPESLSPIASVHGSGMSWASPGSAV